MNKTFFFLIYIILSLLSLGKYIYAEEIEKKCIDIYFSPGSLTAEEGDVLNCILLLRNTQFINGCNISTIRIQFPEEVYFMENTVFVNEKNIFPEKYEREIVINSTVDIKFQEQVRVRWQVKVGSNVLPGNKLISAEIKGKSGIAEEFLLRANTSFELIEYGFFNLRGTILGKIYMDQNENGMQDNGEKGIEGVLIILENGIIVTTGADGKYSIPNLPGGVHVMEIDDWTLPPGIILLSEEERSKFVNLPETGMAEVNFRVKEDW